MDICGLKLHERVQVGSYSILRVHGGWLYSEAHQGTSPVFVPWTKTSDFVHEAFALLASLHRWHGIGMSPNEHFEDIAGMFQLETGWLRPGKSVPAESYCEEGEEERRKAWADWCIEKGQQINESITALMAMSRE